MFINTLGLWSNKVQLLQRASHIPCPFIPSS